MRRASGGFAGAALHPVIGDGGALQVAPRRYAHFRLASRDEPYLVRRLYVERVGHSDKYFPAGRGERHDAQPRGRAFGNQRKRLLRRMNFVKRQKRQAETRRERRGYAVVRRVSATHKRLVEPQPGALLLRERRVELFARQHAAVQQYVRQRRNAELTAAHGGLTSAARRRACL